MNDRRKLNRLGADASVSKERLKNLQGAGKPRSLILGEIMNRYRYIPGKKNSDLLFTILLFILPTLMLISVFQLLPIVKAFEYSFSRINLMSGRNTFVGLQNYRAILEDQRFLHSLKTTVSYFFLRVPLQVGVGFLLSLLIYKKRRWTSGMRTLILIPVITSMVVVTSIMGLMMHPSNGLFNAFLQALRMPPLLFLTSPDQALGSIVFITVWKNVGLTMLFFLAGLLTIPGTLYEAGTIDGANLVQKHVHITIPLLRKTFAFVIITITIRSFQVFGPVLLTTRGGPMDTTRVVVMHIYDNAFVYNRMGYASALSVILAMVLVTISLLQIRISGREQG